MSTDRQIRPINYFQEIGLTESNADVRV